MMRRTGRHHHGVAPGLDVRNRFSFVRFITEGDSDGWLSEARCGQFVRKVANWLQWV